MLVDLERRIVDAVMIILRPVEHDGAALEGVRILADRKDSAARNSSEITLVFMIAESNRLPRKTLNPACAFSGLS